MTPSGDMSIVSLVLHASLVVKVVLSILIALSVISWTLIFQKWFQVRRAERATEDFEKRFWGGAELGSLFEGAQMRREKSGPEEKIFAAGMSEYTKLQGKGFDSAHLLDGVKRAMRAVYQREMDSLEAGLSVLASIGSVSPYIGLFGTVWGVMNAFTGLSTLTNASLAVVAPGIAEALVATAIGLFAAIPAVAAYNFYATATGRLFNRFDAFTEEFLNILERQRR
ncbi:MAG: protein TolQ [Sutterellaceae bacterium]|nr:protein TolQ [Sutterellaceae bacterium]MDD7441127.1 protein TolQ [Sutterellaceae bacterium]MDY2867458.1 protein TolQ [Mesosutterella sp.]